MGGPSTDTGAGTRERRAGIRLTADFDDGDVKEFYLDFDTPEDAISSLESQGVTGVARWSWVRLEWL